MNFHNVSQWANFQKWIIFIFTFTFTVTLKDLQNDVWLVGIGQKITELHPFEVDSQQNQFWDKSS